MKDEVIFQIFLFGLAFSEWVEITKIVNQNTKKLELPKIISSTPPSYEDILVRPQMYYEISATIPLDQNVTETIETHPEIPSLTTVDVENNTFYEDGKITKEDNLTSQEIITNIVYRNSTKIKDILEQQERSNDQGIVDDIKEKGGSDGHVDEEFPGNDFSRFTSDLKNVQNNLLNYKERSLKGKIELLQGLRDNLLYEIKTRMSKLWLPTKEHAKPRGYKDYYPDNNYHMDFPSNEGALMTIGFLTFAVFLIKLVLKLIYTLKYKQQYYVQATSTTAASVFLKRNEREITQDQLEQSARIMQYIQEYPLS